MRLPHLTPGERQQLVSWITGLYKGPILASTGFPKAELAGAGGEADSMTDLGGYAPLLAAAGEREHALGQADLAFRILSASPLIRGLRTRFREPGRAGRLLRALGTVHSQDYAEILIGFLALHRITHDPRPLQWARWTALYLLEQFGTRQGLCSFWLQGKLPVYEPLSGILIESMLDYAEVASDGDVKSRALAALRPFLGNPIFAAFGLWPSWCIPGPKARPLPLPPTRRIDLAKANTSLGNALLRAYALTADDAYADALRRFLFDGLARLRDPRGGIVTRAFAVGEELRKAGTVNASNHAVIELQLDAHRLLRDGRMLEEALALARFWEGQIHPETGLMPDVLGGTESFVDGNTDFAVIFRKIHDLTQERSWLAASEAMASAVARYHRSDLGLVRRTYVATGKVSDPVIETRYSALYLKILLMPAGKSVWTLPALLYLLRDR